MKDWNKISFLFVCFLLTFMGILNMFMSSLRYEAIPNNQIVEINRMVQELDQGIPLANIKTKGIEVQLVQIEDLNTMTYMNHSNQRFVLLPSKDVTVFYQFVYQMERFPSAFLWGVNIVFLCIIITVTILFLFVKNKIIQPLQQLEGVADALRNRDFRYQLPQQKFKFFKKFLWALDVLREELHYYEQKEIEMMKEKKLMISSLSHDIKTPLSNIRLYTEALQKDIFPKETVMIRVEENCEKIDQFVKEIMEANNKDLFNFEVCLEELYMHDIAKVFEREKERVTMVMIAYEQDCYKDNLCKGDIHRLKEVINNIIDNAIKYGDGEWIHVSFYEEDYNTIIKISNSVKNLTLLDSNAIFQSFYRGNNIGKQAGNGLGLYISKQLMKKMEGDIFVTQTAEEISFHIVLSTI